MIGCDLLMCTFYLKSIIIIIIIHYKYYVTYLAACVILDVQNLKKKF